MEVHRLSENEEINNYDLVRFKQTGNIFDVMHAEKISAGGFITKIDKDHFIDNRTGELREFNHIENRSQDIANVAKSIAYGRDLLNANITDVSCCRWLTLTYADNMTDPKKLQHDFKNFNTRCRKLFGCYEYITAAEPQGRGAWHLHAALIFPSEAPFMANDIVRKLWKQGFVNIRKLDNVDNVGAYLSAYLASMELDEAIDAGVGFSNSRIKELECEDENGIKQTKRFVKGARLYLYPAGFHIFRCSKGIKKPDISRITYGEAREIIGSATLTYETTKQLVDPERGYENTLHYQQWNRIRK